MSKGQLGFWARVKGHATNRDGSVMIEFAAAVSVILVIIIGCYDTTRYILLHQKMDRAAATMADLVSQPNEISQSDINSMFSAARELLTPFDLISSGRIIVSSVTRPVGDVNAQVDWQYAGGGSLTATSALGASGGTASIPSGFLLSEGENLIVAEVFFDYTPMFLDYILQTGTFSKLAMRRPRRGDLSTLGIN